MNHVLFANGGWWEILVTVGVIAFWAISSIVRGIADSKEAAPKKAPRPAAPRKPQQQLDPQKELQKFLDELGVKEKASSASTKTPVAVPALEKNRPLQARGPAAPPKPPKVTRGRNKQPEPTVPAGPVRERHLESQLRSRHTTSMQVALEGQHLQTSVGLAALPSQATADPFTAQSPRPRSLADPSVHLLLSDKGQLARAFMLSTIFGRPRGLDDA